MSSAIYVIRRPVNVNVRTRSIIQLAPAIVPFAITAETDGQTDFILDAAPAQIIILSINGVQQNEAAGDFTVVDDTITLSSGVDSGTLVFGVYAAQYTPLVKSFYEVATEGQTVFTLSTAPRATFAVTVDGLLKSELAGDYTISDVTLTFAAPLSEGAKVAVVYQE